MRIKPFLRWAGGKQNLVDELLNHAPSDSVINKYFEPFIGAGSLFFANGFSNAVISDINPQLVNAYVFIKSDYRKVFELLNIYNLEFEMNSDYYYEIRRLFNRDMKIYNYEQAARFIFLIHSNYNGMYRVNKNGDYNVPVGKLKPCIPSLSQLKSIGDKLKNTTIDCFDYRNILTQIEPNDFVYLDPPYPPFEWTNPQNQYTVNNFTKVDHESLAIFANGLRTLGCYILISYPNIQFIRDLYMEWNIVELDTFRSISCKKERKKITEIIIKNY